MYKFANNYDRETLEKQIAAEGFKRIPISFYRYVLITDPDVLRMKLYKEWNELGVLGRIYLAPEGVNAQLCIPEHNFEKFRKAIDAREEFKDVPFKVGLEDSMSFIKLNIKTRKQIVADGLTIDDYDITNVGNHLEPEEFNQAMEDPETIVVDMRNHYESRIGHFQGAITPDVDTFKEQLPMVKNNLKGNEEKKILLYCTGGIRCEKASAYLKHYGFNDVNQLHGGIIDYGHAVKEGRINSKFKGKNFVFDERLSERLTEDILTACDQCGNKADRQINCINETCHLLFIQCDACGEKMNNSCSNECKEFAKLPVKERRRLRKNNSHPTSKARYGERLRPKLNH